MRHIFADFSDLRTIDEEPNVIPLGSDDAPGFDGQELHDGERAIFCEPGSLEAEGVLQARLRQSDGKRFWYAVLDMCTLRRLDHAAASEPA